MDHPPAMILAGGRATRMGGGDKPLLRIGGHRMIDLIATRLSDQSSLIAINANGDPGRFGDVGLPVLPDAVPGRPGPLAGILTAMDWAAALGSPVVLTVSGDTPFLPPDLAARLSGAADGLVPALAASRNGAGEIRDHPTCGLWPVSLRDGLRHALMAGQRRVRDIAQAHAARRVIWPATPYDPFFNVNTPADLALARTILAALS